MMRSVLCFSRPFFRALVVAAPLLAGTEGVQRRMFSAPTPLLAAKATTTVDAKPKTTKKKAKSAKPKDTNKPDQLPPSLTSSVYTDIVAPQTTIPRVFTTKERSQIVSAYRDMSLSDFHPGIAGGFLTTRSKLMSTKHIAPTAVSMAWWRCPDCSHEYRRRIFDQCFLYSAQCPSCGKSPTVSSKYSALTTKFLVRSGTDKVFASKETGATSQNIPFLENSERTYSPMLASGWEKHKLKPDDTVYVSNKLDGIRCIALYDEKEKRLHFISRTGTIIDACDHLVKALLPLFEHDPQLVLDGELYTHKHFKDFQEVVGAVRTSREHRTPAIEALQKQLQYHIFDLMYFDGKVAKLPEKAGYLERLNYMKEMVPKLAGEKDKLYIVDAVPCKVKDVEGMMKAAMKEGYEGVMIRDPKSPYAHNTRSKSLMKFKKMSDGEYEIVYAVEGKGKFAGGVGAFICKTKKGMTFAANPAVSEVMRKEMWKRRTEYVGQVGTVQYQELTRDGVPRFPVLKCVRGAKNGSNWL